MRTDAAGAALNAVLAGVDISALNEDLDGQIDARLNLQGVDILKFDEEGKINEMTVMVRPMTGLQALGDQMGKRLAAMGLEPA